MKIPKAVGCSITQEQYDRLEKKSIEYGYGNQRSNATLSKLVRHILVEWMNNNNGTNHP